MNPVSISEQMMYNTVRLETLTGSSGTGFFFSYEFDNTSVPVLITNKHVVNDNPNETMVFLLHLANQSGNDSGENYRVELSTQWIFHPTHDICFTFVAPLFGEVKRRTGKDVFYRTNSESLIRNREALLELSALESVVMVGYPNGLWDKNHNYPIFRKGYTANHPGYDFNEKSVGLVDMACFPGSSGSPIYILDENGFCDKKGNVYLGEKRLIFLGILFAGPVMNINGDIIVVDIPTQKKAITNAQTMINLGYYAKAYELLKFKSMIKLLLDTGSR